MCGIFLCLGSWGWTCLRRVTLRGLNSRPPPPRLTHSLSAAQKSVLCCTRGRRFYIEVTFGFQQVFSLLLRELSDTPLWVSCEKIMVMIRCHGRHASTGELIEIEAGTAILHVNPLLGGADDGVYVAPGFIDLQVNGFAGADYNSPGTSMDGIAESIRAIFATGVSRFYPTVITASESSIVACLRNLSNAREQLDDGAAMEAFHVEGPHISSEDGPRGAHPRAWVRRPDFDEFQRWQEAARGNVRLVTLSPEWPEAPRYIERLTRESVVCSIGHTRATGAQIQDAVSAGATLSTHLGNGANGTLPKTANYIFDQLAEDRLAASFIVDGHHLQQSFLKTALRAKGVERSVLVTDAVAPAGCPPGLYRLGEQAVELKEDGRVVLQGTDRLAGSSLRMDAAISNAMCFAGVSLTAAVSMATTNAARVGRVPGRLRALQPGERADIVRFRVEDNQVRVEETYLSGHRVFHQS
jgi:N-acetylglucosamine-6-phosphate deacetylase